MDIVFLSLYSQVDDAAIYDVEEEETFSLDDIRSASTQTDVQTGPLTSHQVFSSLGYFYDISLLLFRLVAVALKKTFFSTIEPNRAATHCDRATHIARACTAPVLTYLLFYLQAFFLVYRVPS